MLALMAIVLERCRHENVTQVAEKGGKSKEKAENKGEISLARTRPNLLKSEFTPLATCA